MCALLRRPGLGRSCAVDGGGRGLSSLSPGVAFLSSWICICPVSGCGSPKKQVVRWG